MNPSAELDKTKSSNRTPTSTSPKITANTPNSSSFIYQSFITLSQGIFIAPTNTNPLSNSNSTVSSPPSSPLLSPLLATCFSPPTSPRLQHTTNNNNNNNNNNTDNTNIEKMELLKLSQTDSLDLWKAMSAIHTTSGGVFDFVVNELFKYPDHEIERFIPQLCTRALRDDKNDSLTRFLLDKCASLHLALKMFFWFQGSVEDNVFPRERSNRLWNECEMAAVNSRSRYSIKLNSYLKIRQRAASGSSTPVASPKGRANKGNALALAPYSANVPSISARENETTTTTTTTKPESLSTIPDTGTDVIDSTTTNTDTNTNTSTITTTPNSDTTDRQEETSLQHSSSDEDIAGNEAASATRTQSITEAIETIQKKQQEQTEHQKSNASNNNTIPSIATADIPPTEPDNTNAIPSSNENSAPSSVENSPDSIGRTLSLEYLDADSIFSKKARHTFFHSELQFINSLTEISYALRNSGIKGKVELNHALFKLLSRVHKEIVELGVPLNNKSNPSTPPSSYCSIPAGVLSSSEYSSSSSSSSPVSTPPPVPHKSRVGLYLPICRANSAHIRVVNILAGESYTLSTKDRVPYMLWLETIVTSSTPVTDQSSTMANNRIDNNTQNAAQTDSTTADSDNINTSNNKSDNNNNPATLTVPMAKRDRPSPNRNSLRKDTDYSKEDEGLLSALEQMMVYNREGSSLATGPELNGPNPSPRASFNAKSARMSDDWVMMENAPDNKLTKSPILALAYPELWAEKQERIRKTSKYASDPNWRIQSVIVKSGDDLRQEQLAIQLIHSIHDIFQAADLPLWLYPYSVVATSSHTGLIETIPDAISLDTLKKRIPNMKSLEDYFVAVYGEKTSMGFLQAQRNFVESLAGYSLVCYLLQIKDRHNGNILIDKDGHICHIDYGFMLTSSPGSLNFETAPFKLTKEFIDLMGGEHKDMFHYFKLLFIRGFLEVRKHWEKIILLVEMLLPGSKMNCFARKEATIKELKDRFHLELSDRDCIPFVGSLIRECMGNWRTESYDNYQYYMNNIIP